MSIYHKNIAEIELQNALAVRCFMPRAQVFDHLIGVQNIGSDLVAPACVALVFMGLVDGRIAAVQFQLVQA